MDEYYGTIMIRQHEYDISRWKFPTNITNNSTYNDDVMELFNRITSVQPISDEIDKSLFNSCVQTGCDKRGISITYLTLVLPESYVNPNHMVNLMKLLALLSEQRVMINVLTNSLYILTKLNNLMLKYDLFQQSKMDDKQINMNYDNVRCYMNLKSIKNDETRLILASELDKVGEDIMNEFNDLMKLVDGVANE